MIGNTEYIEQLYADWLADPAAVDPAWRTYIERLEVQPGAAAQAGGQPVKAHKQSRVDSLLWAFRDVGYLYARLNPLGGDYGPGHSYVRTGGETRYEHLNPQDFGLAAEDLDQSFFAGRAMDPSTAPLRDILAAFQQTYCSFIGAEFLHIQDKNIRRWLIHRMESTRNSPALTAARKRIILQDLIEIEELEGFLGTYFIGQKRFSLEGSESVIIGLHALVDNAHQHGIEEIVIGATHRGRLSILKSILGMSPSEIFSRFRENYAPGMFGGSGDVKYHIGYETDHVNEDGSAVHISLVANPSHLESVSPVVEGKTRSLQDKRGDTERRRVVPVVLHGDAGFIGQGVLAETINLSRLQGYGTGGTIHIVINNQVGFTTSARSARSTFFPTDIAKMVQAPVFHVNGDRPEAVVHTVKLALDFRQTFGSDVVIDVFCFRRHGHNEGDEPSFTQPHMYRLIREHPGAAQLYSAHCAEEGVMLPDAQEKFRDKEKQLLRAALDQEDRQCRLSVDTSQGPDWDALDKGYSWVPVATGVARPVLTDLAGRITAVPDGFHIHPKLKRIFDAKLDTIEQKGLVDWAMAESLAFGSLLLEGAPVRLSGEDSCRGTFAQRHLTWWDVEAETPTPYTPLAALDPAQAPMQCEDSPLSEYSVLGFEYGYSLAQPMSLVMWEAQFGDFANGAQVVIDDFIASAEARWGRQSGIVLLVPHGYEGQGPDHSNAHLERYLQLCADDNMQVCNASTPAQYFHLLRRQVKRRFRKPLVVLTPKSLLRHPAAVSSMDDLSAGTFREVLDDPDGPASADRVLLCSGKVYYELAERRAETGDKLTTLLRLEQFAPFPAEYLREILRPHAAAREVIWVQEEQQNYGAWSFVRDRFAAHFPDVDLRYVGRPARPSKATGSFELHKQQQAELIAQALPEAKTRKRTASPKRKAGVAAGKQ